MKKNNFIWFSPFIPKLSIGFKCIAVYIHTHMYFHYNRLMCAGSDITELALIWSNVRSLPTIFSFSGSGIQNKLCWLKDYIYIYLNEWDGGPVYAVKIPDYDVTPLCTATPWRTFEIKLSKNRRTKLNEHMHASTVVKFCVQENYVLFLSVCRKKWDCIFIIHVAFNGSQG